MILLSKNSLVVRYAISLLAGVAIAYCCDLSKESCPVDFKTSQTTLRGDTLHHIWDQLVALSTEPWSCGVFGHPVTMMQVGLFFFMRSTTNCAINSFPLSLSKMLQ
jgi:hypothetical protein